MLTVYGKLVKDYYEWCILEFFSCKVGVHDKAEMCLHCCYLYTLMVWNIFYE